ncbi:MAG: hypothetical protein V3V20_09845 [Algisphaera sp.]
MPHAPHPKTAPWPPSHRLLATVTGILSCLLAGVGCQTTTSPSTHTAIAPNYSYVHDDSLTDLDLWPVVTVDSAVLLSGGPIDPY